MRFSIPRVRGVLIAGAALLVLVLFAYIGLGRYRSLMAYRRLLKRSGVSLTHDTNGFTYSQSLLGRTVFTLHATKATQLSSGKWALHGADLTLFDRAGRPADHITGAEIDYDETTGVAKARGMVEMDLQPPQGLSNGGRAGASVTTAADALAAVPRSAQAVHVRTSGLMYDRKRGTATTDQKVEFHYGGMDCTALGAAFDAQASTLRLLAQVSMQGVAHGQPLHVNAASVEMNRDTNVATLVRPVVSSNGQSAAADAAVLDLRKDGSIERLQGIDHVVLRSKTEVVTAARLEAMLNEQTLPEKARLSGGVVITGTNSARPLQGVAAAVDAVFDAHGAPTTVTASGGAKFAMLDRKADARGLNRSLEGATIVADFVPGRGRSSARLSEVHALGRSHAMGDSIVAVKGAGAAEGRKTVQVSGDDLRMTFVAAPAEAGGKGRVQPQRLYAKGHTVLQEDAPLGAQQISSGDTLEMLLTDGVGKGGLEVASAVQAGHVVRHGRAASKLGSSEPGAVSSGTADRAAYDGATQRLTLTGNAHLDGEDRSLTAPAVTFDQATQDAEAQGGVQATIKSARREGKSTTTLITHVASSSARFGQSTKLAEFRGTDAEPARMWQGASQILAATLLFDGARHFFSARPEVAGALIHAVFAGNPSAPKASIVARPASIVRVASSAMDYNDSLLEATFSGGVTIDGKNGEVKGQRAVLFLSPAAKPADTAAAVAESPSASPFGGTGGAVERVVVSGDVQLEQVGRHGVGEQLLYTAATGAFVLTGSAARPPTIMDAQQGRVTGVTLLFSDAGSTIVVAGDPGAAKARGRVRTEMSVQPKKGERQ